MNILYDFLKICERFPDKIAIEKRDRKYSFLQLKDLAQRYAAALGENIGRDRAVGIICEREIDALAWLMGALFSGNFYVPLDPELPQQKLRSIVEDANFVAIIGSESFRSVVQEAGYVGKYISPQDLTDAVLPIPAEDRQDHPLYMVYTSGSTGKPKGVLKSHRAEMSFINAYYAAFQLAPEEIIGNQTPFFFDAAAKDLYLTLTKGLTLEMIPSECFLLPPELINYLNEKKITFASWVPSVLSIVAQLNPFSMVKPETLKSVFFVGEVMPMKHLNTWRRELPELRYVNLYGQSELCGICCYFPVSGEFRNDESLPMGKPLSNCRIYLLDQDRIITEPGVVGEMYIVSDALAMEYFHDPEKTAASFLVKDFGNGPERCFKTGDLAQYNSAGDLVFAARSDFQIKHMGYRIELGEIETIAGAMEEINRCCCLYDAEKKKIVLFCEPNPSNNKTGVQLKSDLKTRLPPYMVPGKVILLEHLPLNANGKIDRTKLKTML